MSYILSVTYFTVDLEVDNFISAPLPYTRDEESQFKYTRSTFIPGLFHDNRVLKHGDQFSLSGAQAKYLYDLITDNLCPAIKIDRVERQYWELVRGGIKGGGTAPNSVT
jgi:hypothetical protein